MPFLPRRPPVLSRSLTSRLFLSYALVVVVGIVTAGLVAAVIGPPFFHDHLVAAGHTPGAADLDHVEEAYADASLISLGVALAVSSALALAVSWWITRRLRQPLSSLTHAARELSRGHYDTRVPVTGVGTELDTLSEAFNSMAIRLEQTEVTRRRLLADLAHELRTPIATLMTYHDALRDGVASVNDEVVDVLAGQTGRLARLAADISEVSVAEEGQLSLRKSSVLVDDLIDEAAEAARDQYARKNVNLVTVAPKPPGLTVTVDRLRIAQVLSNLLSNALRHTPTRGVVSMSVRAVGEEIHIIVADDGEGMTPDQLLHAFERFFRGDSARDRDRSGSGVGLTISKAIADLHGGSLSASSDGPSRGSKFLLTLPMATTQRRSQAIEPHPNAEST
ncbi:MAG: ATP-binding protein [Candidatus Nanopelagicales bacterium]|nr:ATP-binding protein [Candidatus Nanopelagicales bacterium]MCU0522743.1 ATP-binding protein [Anaerolineae bacterium]